jgi:hypothetical protein
LFLLRGHFNIGKRGLYYFGPTHFGDSLTSQH